MIKAKRKIKALVCFAMGTAVCLVYGGALGASGSIEVKKEWDHGTNPAENRPDRVEVSLVRDGETVEKAVLSAKNGWKYIFANVPRYDSEGRIINYTFSERSVDGYISAIVQQPVVGGLNISSVSQKITPAKEDTYEIGGATLVIAKTTHSSQKEYSYCVWTEQGLSEAEKAELIELVNKGNLQGLGRDLTVNNTAFRSGSGAVFTLGGESVTVGGLSGKHAVTFSNTRAWALFYHGTINRLAAKGGVISNTFVRETTPAPDKTPLPDTTAGPESTRTPDMTVMPEITKTPEITSSPDATVTPGVTNTPVATQTPAAEQTPAATPSPGVETTVKPTATITPSPSPTPVIGSVEETPKSGDPSVVLWAVAAIIAAAGIYYFLTTKNSNS